MDLHKGQKVAQNRPEPRQTGLRDLEELLNQTTPCMVVKSSCQNLASWRWVFQKPCSHIAAKNYCSSHHKTMRIRLSNLVVGWRCTDCGGPSTLVRYFRI